MQFLLRWVTLLVTLSCLTAAPLAMAELSGLIDLRAVNADNTKVWLYEGLGKQRFDDAHDGLKLGQAILDLRGNLSDTITGKLVFNGYDDRNGFADVTEAYLQWKPLPFESYRIKAKLGAFFPAISLENNGVGWSNPWMLSTSAINNWVGEELRTLGTELSWSHPGNLNNSPHDFDLSYALFTANDPATSLIAWRGWSIGDRVTGLTERLPLPDMPDVYGSTGIFDSQENSEKPFTEIDHHYGYYMGASYGYNNWVSVRALHYSNRGNPLGINDGQWSWLTSFNHFAVKVDFENDFSILTQIMRGKTRWGIEGYGVNATYEAWYLLLSQAIGKHRISLRYDNFKMADKDHVPDDDNSEHGHAVALTWLVNLNESNQTGIEYLKILSTRAGREYLGGAVDETAGSAAVGETTLQIFYRHKF
jgi:hypothetical protein